MTKPLFLKKLKEDSKVKNSEKILYIYRYDIFAIAIILLSILLYFDQLVNPGQIVFSDIDFPFNSEGYLNEIFGLWNNNWNTTSMLNIPRLFIVLPTYILSVIGGFDGSVFLKTFILQQVILSALSIYLFSKRLISIYMGSQFNLIKILGIIFGSLFYALNPYLIYRIQHIYLLIGYSLFPLVLLYFFKAFDHKFQAQFIKGYNRFSNKIYFENVRDLFLLAFIITYASAAIHYFFYSVMALTLIYVLLIVKYTYSYKKLDLNGVKKMIVVMLKKLLIFLAFFLGMSLFWLSIYIGSIIVGAAASQHNINVIDTYTLFSRNSDIMNVLFFTSYWWQMVPEGTFSIVFYASGGVLLVIIAVGVIFYGAKNHIVTLLTILAGAMIFLATGVFYPQLASVFLKLCGLPFFGNVFRDPNKLIGLLAISFSVLISFGLESLVLIINRNKNRRITTYLLFGFVGLSLAVYLSPMKTEYLNRYLKPVEEPESYIELREYFKDSDDVYSVYLPTAEQMLRPIHNISTPKWNTHLNEDWSKATGDVHIYNSPVKTLFHHEGNDPAITKYFNWIQELLDKGRTINLYNYIKALGANKFIYHDEYLDQEKRQDFNKEIIDLQDNMKIEYDNDIFSVIDTKSNESNLIDKKIWTPYGLYKFEIYNRLDNYSPIKNPVVFMNQNDVEFNLKSVEGDYIDFEKEEDIIFAALDNEYKVYPFEWVNELNPFLKWSKTYLGNLDWTWYMGQLDNNHKSFDFDKEKGVVVTFSSGKLDVAPHVRKQIKGNLIMDFDTMIRTDTFFVADTPALYDVKANPMDELGSVGAIHGVISRGDPNDIWQVAKSKLIRANENTPYSYNILLSGRHVNKLHVKVRFFDKDREEIGIQYVVAPNEVVDFEAVNFTGETISPKGTKYMRLDLLSFQRPEVKTYWWIHDVNIYDYSEYKAENVINGDFDVRETDDYEIYMRVFKSLKSGELLLNIDEEEFNIDTVETRIGFEWIKLDSIFLEEGIHTMSLKNVSGFNAVNQIVYIPLSRKSEILKPIYKAMEKGDQLITFEGEKDFYYIGNEQSRRFIPKYSYGAGLALSEGILYQEFDIFESNNYSIDTDIYFPYLNTGKVIITITNAEGFEYKMEIEKEAYLENDLDVINYNPLSTNYIYDLIKRDSKVNYINKKVNEDVYLEKGTYQIEVAIDSQVNTLTDIYDLRKFNGEEILVSKFLDDPYYQECNPCESITMDMFNHEYANDEIEITYDPTCSCDWYIYSSEQIPVDVEEELRVSFDAKSEKIEFRHPKMLFIDEYDHIVDIQFVFEVEEQEKNKWNSYEQLIRIPEGTKKVMFQFWARGHKKEEGFLKIKNLRLEKYDDYITLDYLTITEKHENNDLVEVDFTVEKKGPMSFNMNVNSKLIDEYLWNSFISPTNLWKLNGKSYDFALNGVTMGYIVDKEKNEARVVLRKVYLSTLALHFITVFLGLFILFKMKGKK